MWICERLIIVHNRLLFKPEVLLHSPSLAHQTVTLLERNVDMYGIVTLILILVVTASAEASDLFSSPEATLKTYMRARQAGNSREASRCVVGEAERQAAGSFNVKDFIVRGRKDYGGDEADFWNRSNETPRVAAGDVRLGVEQITRNGTRELVGYYLRRFEPGWKIYFIETLSASARQFKLNQYGTGEFRLRDRADEFRRVEVESSLDGTVEVRLMLVTGRRVEFSGLLRSYDRDGFRVRLTDARRGRETTGSVRVDLNERGQIAALTGQGEFSGRDFAIEFNVAGLKPTLPPNISQRGTGSYEFNRRKERMTSVTVRSRNRENLDVLLYTSESVIELTGRLARASSSSFDIEITSASASGANGYLRVEYTGASLRSLKGQGNIGGRPFSVDFKGISSAGRPADVIPSDDFPMLLAQNGTGTLETRREREYLRNIVVRTRDRENVELTLTTDRRVLELSGRVTQSARGYFDVDLAGRAEGYLRVNYTFDGGIESVKGQGSMDKIPFSIDFRK